MTLPASTEPHKYRCETCEHFQTRFEYGNKKMCIKIRKKFSNSYQIGLPLYTEIVGCASHSDATKAEQRNALLDEVYKRLKSLHYSIWQSPQSFGQKDVVNWSDIDCLFAELKSEPVEGNRMKAGVREP